MKPRLLCISGTFFAKSGGAEISAHCLLRLLMQEWQVSVLTCNFNQKYKQYNYEGIQVVSVPYEKMQEEALGLIHSYSPKLIYSVMLGSDYAMRLGRECGIPTIVNICKVPIGPRYLKANPPTKVLAVSAYVQKYLRAAHGVASTVVHPIVSLKCPPHKQEPRFITIFNPVDLKGGGVFRAMAARLPSHQFAWVPGWDILRGTNGMFNPVICEAICRSIDLPFRGGTPKQICMDLPNITQLAPCYPPNPIFQKTRILLVPSQWEEAFGRVAVEAIQFGIPVVGSRVGGLAEIVDSGGISLPPEDVEAWIAEVQKLDGSDYISEVKARGKEWLSLWNARDSEEILSVFRGI